MSNGKTGEGKGILQADSQESAPRARNRTVMLTPDITTQVRARLSKKVSIEQDFSTKPDLSENTPAENTASGSSISLPYEQFLAENPTVDVDVSSEFASPEFGQENEYSTDTYTEDTNYQDQAFNHDLEQNTDSFNPIARQVHTLETDIQVHPKYKTASEEAGRDEVPPEKAQTSKKVVIQSTTKLNAESVKESNVSQSVGSAEVIKPKISNQILQENNMENPSFNVYWSKLSPIVGFFVSFDDNSNGEFLVLRSGRLLVSSELPTSGSYVYINDETISPMHAILRVTEDGQVQLLDNLSEYGTLVVRAETSEEINLSGEKSMLYHGDLVKFGSRSFYLCLLKVA